MLPPDWNLNSKKLQMRLAKEMVVNLTVNEHIRNRVSKTRRGFMGLFRKKNEIPCEAYTNL